MFWNLNRGWFQDSFALHNHVRNKGQGGCKGKNQSSFKISYFQEFLPCIGCFELFTKIKKESGTSFRYTFSAYFLDESSPYLILYQLTKFQYQTYFLSQHIKQYVILNSCIAKRWRHKCKSSSQETADRRKTSGRGKYKNLNNLRTKKVFRWNKKQ